MRSLTKKEWIAVVIALIVIVVLLGSRFIPQTTSVSTIDQINISTTTNNTMDQNTNASSTSGFIVKDVVIGTGATAQNGNMVEVNYTGKFNDANGKVFDSSIPRGQPIPFVLGEGQVIPGWDQGILGMKVGGKRTLTIPSELGYGAAGRPPVIPPNSTLYFEVELVSVQAQ